MLPQQRFHVSTTFTNTQTTCKKDLIWRRRRHLQSRCRSSSVEFGSPSTIAAFGVTPAVNRTRRSGSRAAFLSRGPTFGGRRTDLVSAETLGPFSPTRHRDHPGALSTGVGPYERTPQPAWQPEPANWWHSSPAAQAWSLLLAEQPPSSADGRRCPNWASGPLVATFLMLVRSRGAIGRVRATPGAPPTAGRSTDGPDARVDGSPAWERG